VTFPVSTMVAEADLEMAWTRLPPGPELAIALSLVEWESLADRELADAMAAARRQIAWTQSVQLSAVGELAARHYARDGRGDSEIHHRIAAEVSLELTVGHGQAEELVWLAQDLPERLPCTWAALRCGQVDLENAKVLADGLASVDEGLARRLDEELVHAAADCTRTLLRRRVRRAVKDADPEAAAERTKQAKAERRTELWDNADGTCDLVGRNVDAQVAHAIHNRLTAAAKAMKADGDTRSVGQIRLDLHNALLRGIPLPEAVRHLIADPNGYAPTAQPAEHGTDELLHDGPADLTDVIAAVEELVARALAEAADEQLTGLLDRVRAAGRLDSLTLLIGQAVQTINNALAGLVDSWCGATGTNPGSHGHHGYRPPAAMQRLVQRRHPTCVFPTCHRRSVHCDIDHTVPYDKGGRTCKCNLAPLCRMHHRLVKQHPTWKLLQPWSGLLIWVTPSGTWHIVTPK
jgi:hypothetical protein